MEPQTQQQEHLDEMRALERRLKESAGRRVIIAGDFNFSGATLQAAAIRWAGFHNTLEQSGAGRGSTWPVNSILRWVPGFRLDHIFLSRSLHCRWIRTGTGAGSDHRPLIAEIGVRDE